MTLIIDEKTNTAICPKCGRKTKMKDMMIGMGSYHSRITGSGAYPITGEFCKRHKMVVKKQTTEVIEVI